MALEQRKWHLIFQNERYLCLLMIRDELPSHRAMQSPTEFVTYQVIDDVFAAFGGVKDSHTRHSGHTLKIPATVYKPHYVGDLDYVGVNSQQIERFIDEAEDRRYRSINHYVLLYSFHDLASA
jgi:hypothetical protein